MVSSLAALIISGRLQVRLFYPQKDNDANKGKYRAMLLKIINATGRQCRYSKSPRTFQLPACDQVTTSSWFHGCLCPLPQSREGVGMTPLPRGWAGEHQSPSTHMELMCVGIQPVTYRNMKLWEGSEAQNHIVQLLLSCSGHGRHRSCYQDQQCAWDACCLATELLAVLSQS